MRYGILSDIHGNLPALETVLAEMREENVAKYICAGDVVGYNPWPNECCELIRELECVTVMGNHDEAAVIPGNEEYFNQSARKAVLWTRERLTPENREWLRSLSPTQTVGGAIVAHGSLHDPYAYVSTPMEAMPTFVMMRTRICFIGHTHVAEWYELPEGAYRPIQHLATGGDEFGLEDDVEYAINQGSVGQPRDGDTRASFAIWDDEQRSVQIRRLVYDIERVKERIAEEDLPYALGARLSVGI